MQQFLTPIKLCYNAACSDVAVPWVTQFEEISDKNIVVAILSKTSGKFAQGLYTRIGGYWHLALNYDDLCSLISTGIQIRLVIDVASTQNYPAGTKIYRNSFFLPGVETISAGLNVVWVAGIVPASGGGVVELTDLFGIPLGNFVVE